MKTTVSLKTRGTIRTCTLKLLLSLFCLYLTTTVHAQTKIKDPAEMANTDPKLGLSNGGSKTLLCATNTFTLSSSTQDASGTPYDKWNWQELDVNGAPAALPADAVVTNEKLTIKDAAPGWHTYQVTAAASTAECPADPVLFTVFVLPPIRITSDLDNTNSPSLTYCAASGAPTGTKAITFKSTVAYSTAPRSISGNGFTLTAPTIDQFELEYTWFRVDAGGTETAVTNAGPDPATYTIDDAPVTTEGGTSKQYTYKVKVGYKVKDCGLADAVAQHNSAPAVITVTPKPGKPTITIE